MSIFPCVYFGGGGVLICLCVLCVSNDAVGHNRRWHLLLMVTPAHGRPHGQAPGLEKLGREVEEGGGGHITATVDHQMEMFWMRVAF